MSKIIARVARLAQQITEAAHGFIVGWEASETYVQFCCESDDFEFILKVTLENDDEGIIKIDCDEYPFDQVNKYMMLNINDEQMIRDIINLFDDICMDFQDYGN